MGNDRDIRKGFLFSKAPICYFSGGASYLMFPEESFVPWCVAVWVATLLDLFTRWLAIFAKHGGIRNSFRTKAWNSEAMFYKTSLKITSCNTDISWTFNETYMYTTYK